MNFQSVLTAVVVFVRDVIVFILLGVVAFGIVVLGVKLDSFLSRASSAISSKISIPRVESSDSKSKIGKKEK